MNFDSIHKQDTRSYKIVVRRNNFIGVLTFNTIFRELYIYLDHILENEAKNSIRRINYEAFFHFLIYIYLTSLTFFENNFFSKILEL